MIWDHAFTIRKIYETAKFLMHTLEVFENQVHDFW